MNQDVNQLDLFRIFSFFLLTKFCEFWENSIFFLLLIFSNVFISLFLLISFRLFIVLFFCYFPKIFQLIEHLIHLRFLITKWFGDYYFYNNKVITFLSLIRSKFLDSFTWELDFAAILCSWRNVYFHFSIYCFYFLLTS